MGSHLGHRFLKLQQTRMHSSRMRTGRSLTVYWSLLPGGGVCSSGGVSAPRGVGVGGVCSRGSAPGGVCSGGVCSWGVSAPKGGVCSRGLDGGNGVVSQHALRQTHPPVNRMTDRCKNITLATTSLRPVKSLY